MEHCLHEGGDGGDESAHIACTIFVLYLFCVFGIFCDLLHTSYCDYIHN